MKKLDDAGKMRLIKLIMDDEYKVVEDILRDLRRLSPEELRNMPELNQGEWNSVAFDRTVDAIKSYRDRVGCDLVTAKDKIEYERGNR